MSQAAEGPQLHSFQPSKLASATIDDDVTVDDDGNSTIPEEQNDTNMNDTDNEADREGSVELLGKEVIEEVAEERNVTKLSKSPNAVNVIDVSEDEEGEESSSGTSVLPLSKIKKIFKTDPEHVSASEAAVFTTAVATELFIQYFTEQASLIARSEKRKKLQYKDFANAASSIEQLHFISDIVPKTYNLKNLVENDKVKYAPGKRDKSLDKGQGTLDFKKAPGPSKSNDDFPESDDEDDVGYDYVDNDEEEVEEQRPVEQDRDDSDDEPEQPKDNDQTTDDEQPKDKDNDIIMG